MLDRQSCAAEARLSRRFTGIETSRAGSRSRIAPVTTFDIGLCL